MRQRTISSKFKILQMLAKEILLLLLKIPAIILVLEDTSHMSPKTISIQFKILQMLAKETP